MLLAPIGLLLSSYILFLPVRGAPPTDCHALLLQAYKSIGATVTANSESEMHHMQMRTEVFYIPPGQKKEQHTVNTLEAYWQGNKSTLQTPLTTTWQDDLYTVTVIKPRKIVFIGMSQALDNNNSFGNVALLRDSLLQESTITQCKDLNTAGRERYLELKLIKKTALKTHAQSICFWIDVQKKVINKIQVNYLPGQLQTRTIITIMKQEHLGSTRALPLNARRQVLTVDGRLRPAYAGYRLVDQSTQRPK